WRRSDGWPRLRRAYSRRRTSSRRMGIRTFLRSRLPGAPARPPGRVAFRHALLAGGNGSAFRVAAERREAMKRLPAWLDTWAEHSRLNPYRLLVMPHPRLTEANRVAFDRLLAATPEGGDVDYGLSQPKWWFLHHAARSGFLLHGTNEGRLEALGTRANNDAFGAPVDAVFASDDAIWAVYFAVVRREALRYGYINSATHVRNSSRYVFSIGADPTAPDSWTDGTIYLLPGGSFRRTGSSRELVSETAVKPRARLAVTPEDFPFRTQTIEHGAGDTPARVVFRHALRFRRGRKKKPPPSRGFA